jgi:hypothetical protein
VPLLTAEYLPNTLEAIAAPIRDFPKKIFAGHGGALAVSMLEAGYDEVAGAEKKLATRCGGSPLRRYASKLQQQTPNERTVLTHECLPSLLLPR